MAIGPGNVPHPYYQTGGINTYVNPLLQDGALIHAVNVVSFPYGAKTKRGGYSPFLGTPDNAQVNSLLDFHRNDGTTFNLFRASGSVLYQSTQGTGAWTVTGNGTIANGAHFGAAILDNTFIGGDGVGSTRYTTNGTSFTNGSLAPIAAFFEQYQNRVFAAGTASDLFYSTTNDATNWNTSGTSDSSSIKIPGAGKLSKIFKTADKLVTTKNSGVMHKYDGYSVIDMCTKYGPSSPYSVAAMEDARFYMNQYGHFLYTGARPQILSNPIQRQFYNVASSGIAGSVFPNIPAECHIYDYVAAVGTIVDDFTSRTISNAIIKYDYQKNEYLNWSFANNPTAWLSFKDTNLAQQLIFGDTSGQCYQMDNTLTDNGVAITAEMVFLFTLGAPGFEKKWNFWRGFFNPGCEAKVQVACADVLSYANLNWQDIGDVSNGVVEFRFPPASRSKFLFLRIYDSSTNSRFSYYGSEIQAQLQIIE